MKESIHNTNHSADVRIQLNVNGFSLPVAQLGPGFIIMRNEVEHAASEAELVLSIDGRERRWKVNLPDGISPTRVRTKIA